MNIRELVTHCDMISLQQTGSDHLDEYFGHKNSGQAEAWFHSLLDTAVDGIIVTDAAGRILAFNKACENLFGYSAAEILGKGIYHIMPRREAASHGKHLSRYMETGEKRIIGVGRELSARHRDGDEFPIELSIGEADTTSGRQFIGIIRDLRGRKQAEARQRQLQGELEHLSRVSAMNELGSAIAHELNQPLTAIMLYLQVAVRQDGASKMDKETLETLSKAAHEAERAGKILRSMRRFVEKREMERRAVDVSDVIKEVIELMRHALQEQKIRLKFLLPDAPAMVSADAIQIQQVLINLIRNAMSALKELKERHILIEASLHEGCLEVGVEDSGPGIDPDKLPLLFQAFASNSTGGMGLGLAISRSIAQRHDGDLTVGESRHHSGARFVLRLPLVDKDSGSARAEDRS